MRNEPEVIRFLEAHHRSALSPDNCVNFRYSCRTQSSLCYYLCIEVGYANSLLISIRYSLLRNKAEGVSVTRNPLRGGVGAPDQSLYEIEHNKTADLCYRWVRHRIPELAVSIDMLIKKEEIKKIDQLYETRRFIETYLEREQWLDGI